VRPGDDKLLGRLRQLSLVDIDALLAGSSGEHRSQLLAAFTDDLCDALGQARARIRDLAETELRGPDPLALIEVPPASRTSSAAAAGAERAAARLRARADACRALAQLDDAAALLLPRLFEADRRR
jgi:hypothetical protein